jgi:adenine specific DNA methylase Mod
MKNRMIGCKRQLLDDNGAICIAIDDEEYAHLKVLCDDVFGT